MTHSPTIDLSKFVKNERANEWRVTISVTGSVEETVTASSKDEAIDKVHAMIEAGQIEASSSDYDVSFDIDYARPSSPLYLVRRDGQNIQVSHPKPGDEPRQPDERGF